MKKFRFILALVLVLTMVLSTPLMAMAATHEAYGSDDIYNAFETDTDDEVIINMKNDIVMDYGDTLYSNEGQNYTINGNGNTLSDVVIDGAGNVAIDADITSENNYAALIVGGEANVTVTGDVTGADCCCESSGNSLKRGNSSCTGFSLMENLAKSVLHSVAKVSKLYCSGANSEINTANKDAGQ